MHYGALKLVRNQFPKGRHAKSLAVKTLTHKGFGPQSREIAFLIQVRELIAPLELFYVSSASRFTTNIDDKDAVGSHVQRWK